MCLSRECTGGQIRLTTSYKRPFIRAVSFIRRRHQVEKKNTPVFHWRTWRNNFWRKILKSFFIFYFLKKSVAIFEYSKSATNKDINKRFSLRNTRGLSLSLSLRLKYRQWRTQTHDWRCETFHSFSADRFFPLFLPLAKRQTSQRVDTTPRDSYFLIGLFYCLSICRSIPVDDSWFSLWPPPQQHFPEQNVHHRVQHTLGYLWHQFHQLVMFRVIYTEFDEKV